MPWPAKKPCPHPGCGRLIEGHETACDRHRRERQRRVDQARGSSAKRGYGRRWRRYREAFLRDHPLCVDCLEAGISTPATEVDHVKAVKGPDDPGFWEPANHAARCKPCHSRKTATEDGGFGRG